MKIILSYAQSIDGKIATVTGDSQWISGPQSLELAHELRRDCQAILVGIGTVLKDNPVLSCRHATGCRDQPLRIILDSKLRTPLAAKVLQELNRQPTLIACSQTADQCKKQALIDHGVQICELPSNQHGLDLSQLVVELESRGIISMFVEGGQSVITSFLASRLITEAWIVIAPLYIGAGIAAVGDLGVCKLSQAIRLQGYEVLRYGNDIVWKLTFLH